MDHIQMLTEVEWQERMWHKQAGDATAEKSPRKTALKVCTRTARKSRCNTDDCCRTEPLCSASLVERSAVAKFSTSQFPATNDVSRQIGAATYTVAVRSQHKANYP